MLLAPDKLPRTVLSRVLASGILTIVMGPQPLKEILSGTNIEFASRIPENVCPKGGHGEKEYGSRGRTRTYNPLVNSQLLYH